MLGSFFCSFSFLLLPTVHFAIHRVVGGANRLKKMAPTCVLHTLNHEWWVWLAGDHMIYYETIIRFYLIIIKKKLDYFIHLLFFISSLQLSVTTLALPVCPPIWNHTTAQVIQHSGGTEPLLYWSFCAKKTNNPRGPGDVKRGQSGGASLQHKWNNEVQWIGLPDQP